MKHVRVLVVDDSAVLRKLISDLLNSDPEIEVVGTAADPYAAWDAIHRLSPDVLTLDIEMPRMNGLDFLSRLMRARPLPVVMVSTLTERNSEIALRALSLGAVECVAKPKLDPQRNLAEVGAELVSKVKAACGAQVRSAHARQQAAAQPATRAVGSTAYRRIVAIGASTGGTEALSELLGALPANSPGIVIVQHMPGHFTGRFAERLDRETELNVHEATDGAAITPGSVLIAPGSSQHMRVETAGGSHRVRLSEEAVYNRHRPSVDLLFLSCAERLGPRTVGIILTGMGDDGAAGLLAMRKAGARTVAQDEATCVVFGMPREAIARGAAERILPLDRIAEAILELAR